MLAAVAARTYCWQGHPEHLPGDCDHHARSDPQAQTLHADGDVVIDDNYQEIGDERLQHMSEKKESKNEGCKHSESK